MNTARSTTLLALAARRHHSRSPRAAATAMARTRPTPTRRQHGRTTGRPRPTRTAGHRRAGTDTTAGTAATRRRRQPRRQLPRRPSSSRPTGCPEAEHGFLYQMVGDDYEIDAGKAYVTGPLIDAGRQRHRRQDPDPLRRRGAAASSPSPRSCTTTTTSLLGYVYTDEAIQYSGDFPTVAIVSGFEKNPQMIMWDPETYPDVDGIADLGEAEGVKIRYFGGAAYMDYFTGTGILSADQVDGSYTGDPASSSPTRARPPSRASARPSRTSTRTRSTDWGKPVKYEYINDAGWENYAESIATKPENIESTPTASPSSCRSSSRPASTTSPTRPAPTRSSSTPSTAFGETSAGCTPRARPTTASRRSRTTAWSPTAPTARSATSTWTASNGADRDRRSRCTPPRAATPKEGADRRGHRHQPVHRPDHRSLIDLNTRTPVRRASARASLQPRLRLSVASPSSCRITCSSTLAPASMSAGCGVLGDVVAEAVDARREDHRRRAHAGQHLRVVAGAARHPPGRVTQPLRASPRRGRSSPGRTRPARSGPGERRRSSPPRRRRARRRARRARRFGLDEHRLVGVAQVDA